MLSRSLLGIHESEGRAGLQDLAGVDRALIDEVGQLDGPALTAVIEVACRTKGAEIPFSLYGDCQTKPIRSGDREAQCFF